MIFTAVGQAAVRFLPSPPFIDFQGSPIAATIEARPAAIARRHLYSVDLAFTDPMPQHALHGCRFGTEMVGQIRQ
jgi:hypothetical protein